MTIRDLLPILPRELGCLFIDALLSGPFVFNAHLNSGPESEDRFSFQTVVLDFLVPLFSLGRMCN